MVFLIMTPYSHVVGYRRFGAPYYLQIHPYTASQSRRPRLVFLWPWKPTIRYISWRYCIT